MLRRLSVENYALIDSLTLELDPHLNIITGETGAGKSILLGALGMLYNRQRNIWGLCIIHYVLGEVATFLRYVI